MTTMDFVRKLSDESLLIEASRVYLRRYSPIRGDYLTLSEYDEAIRAEYKFRNNMDYADTIYATNEPRDKYRDCTRFIQLEYLANFMLEELKIIDKSSSWFPRLQETVEELIPNLDRWTVRTHELTLDCQSAANEFKDKL